METVFRFREHPTSVNVTRLVAEQPKLRSFRERLTARFLEEHPDPTHPNAKAAAQVRAQNAVERLVIAAMTDFGESYVGKKGALIDQIVSARKSLSDFYDALLSSKKVGRADPAKMRRNFAELRRFLQDVSTRAEDMIGKDTEKPTLEEARRRFIEDVCPTTKKRGGRALSAAKERRLRDSGFRIKNDSGFKKYRRGRLEIQVDGANRFKVISMDTHGNVVEEFGEFDTLKKPYRDKPLSSRVMQAHHGCQDVVMADRFGDYGYVGSEAPTIWLRDSTGDSPHGLITHEMQNPQQSTRINDSDRSYAKIRQWAVADLRRVNAPEEAISAYLAAMDAHFNAKILPNIPKELVPTLVGKY
jgi:hypothetical protein